MKTIETEEAFHSFIAKDKPAIVLFATHDCATCVPVAKKIDERFQDIDKAKVYLDDLSTLRGFLSIFNVPVVCIYFEQKEFARFIRVFSMDEIEEKINRLLGFL